MAKTNKTETKGTAENMADEAQKGFEAMADFFMIPKLDLSMLGDFHRKNFDASYQAGKILADGSKAILAKQVEMGRDMAQEFSDVATGAAKAADDSSASGVAGMSAFQSVAQKGMANMRDLADIAFDANQKAFAVMQARYSESLAELRAEAE